MLLRGAARPRRCPLFRRWRWTWLRRGRVPRRGLTIGSPRGLPRRRLTVTVHRCSGVPDRFDGRCARTRRLSRAGLGTDRPRGRRSVRMLAAHGPPVSGFRRRTSTSLPVKPKILRMRFVSHDATKHWRISTWHGSCPRMCAVVHSAQTIYGDMGVDLGCRQRGVTEQFLDHAEVGAAF